jgi:hypothetical protein
MPDRIGFRDINVLNSGGSAMRMRLVGIAIIAATSAMPAVAEVKTVGLGSVSFYDTPYTYDFGGGNSVTFTTVDKGFSFAPAGVSTSGSAQITSLGAPFYNPPQPTSYFSNRGGSIGPDTLAQYIGYSTPTAIAYSIVDSIVGLRFDLGQGYQYGYAQIAGSTLRGFRYETTSGVGVNIAAVPEPASWALLISGFSIIGLALRRRRRQFATA